MKKKMSGFKNPFILLKDLKLKMKGAKNDEERTNKVYYCFSR